MACWLFPRPRMTCVHLRVDERELNVHWLDRGIGTMPAYVTILGLAAGPARADRRKLSTPLCHSWNMEAYTITYIPGSAPLMLWQSCHGILFDHRET